VSGVEWAVHRLLHRYVAAVDGREPGAVATCFGADGVLAVRGHEYTGNELCAFYRERLVVPTLHFVTGISVTERPDGVVTSTCGLFAIEMHGDGWRGVAGRYDDVIRVDGDDATFVRRTIILGERVRLSPQP
jgi:SnoaL-like domain